ncbi:MAG: RHS repeat-associated core domain-containing protein [Christensenellaceae bacterium]|jgi:RHS repeat-associated protein|nr:RHS repeat-associated core domain-containing protein [Christensenellaceae bacterium]
MIHTFDLGKAGNGGIDMISSTLTSGSLTYVHEDVSPISNVKGVSVIHTYCSYQDPNKNTATTTDPLYGKNFDISLRPHYNKNDPSDFYQEKVDVVFYDPATKYKYKEIRDHQTQVVLIEFQYNITGMLNKIIYANGREIQFNYSNNTISKITYPDGDCTYIESQNGGSFINKIYGEAKAGVLITWTNNKVSNIKNTLHFASIKPSGVADYGSGGVDGCGEMAFTYLSGTKAIKNDVATGLQIDYERTDKTNGFEVAETVLNNPLIGDITYSRDMFGNNTRDYCYCGNHSKRRLVDPQNSVTEEGSTSTYKTAGGDIVRKDVSKTFEYGNGKLEKETLTTWVTENGPVVIGELICRGSELNYSYDLDDKLEEIVQRTFTNSYSKTVGIIQKRLPINPLTPDIQEWETYHANEPAKRLYHKVKVEEGRTTEEYSELNPLKKTSIEYLPDTNVAKKVTDPDSNEISVNFKPDTYEVTEINANVSGIVNKTDISHAKDFLTSLSSNSGGNKTVYDFEYYSKNGSLYNSKQDIKIDGTVYVSTAHKRVSGVDIVTSTYASGEKIETRVDAVGGVVETYYYDAGGNEQALSTQVYGEHGIVQSCDCITGEIINYTYDTLGTLIGTENNQIPSALTSISLNNSAQPSSLLIRNRETGIIDNYSFSYDNKGDFIWEYNHGVGKESSSTKDKLGRLDEFKMNGVTYKIGYKNGVAYSHAGGSGVYTTNFANSLGIKNGATLYTYDYDDRGNVSEYAAGGNTSKYEYDGINRLKREDNQSLNKTEVFTYDDNGNILTKTVYPFSPNIPTNNLTNGDVIAYTYSGDKLTLFNGQSCIYDILGNPTTYRGKTLTWERLKNLKSIGGVIFDYNVAGLRTRKTNGFTQTKYIWNGDRLMAEKRTVDTSSIDLNIYCGDDMRCGDDLYSIAKPVDSIKETLIHFTYNHTTGIDGFRVKKTGEANWTQYNYRKNLQGDITHVLNSSNVVVAQYVYDAWGNCTIVTDVDGIGTLNPFRYRGYYYDVETGLYYLKSRYYDPQTGRFINQDDISYLQPSVINGLNLYAYCLNNPIAHTDPNGNVIPILLLFGVAALVGAGVGFGVSVGTQWATNGWNDINWGVAGVDALFGALTGVLAVSPIGVLGQMAVGGMLSMANYALASAVQGTQIIEAGLFMSFGIGLVAGAFRGNGLTYGAKAFNMANGLSNNVIQTVNSRGLMAGIDAFGRTVGRHFIQPFSINAVQAGLLRFMGGTGTYYLEKLFSYWF